MFKISFQEVEDILFEELPDALASSDVSDDDCDLEVSTSIDKTIENNFEKTFNSLLDIKKGNNIFTTDQEKEACDKIGLNEEVDIEPLEDRSRPTIDSQEVSHNPDETIIIEQGSGDAESVNLPGPSKPKNKKKYIHKKESSPSRNLKRKGNKDREEKVAKDKKPSKRQIEERLRVWKKKETHIPDTPYNISEGKTSFLYIYSGELLLTLRHCDLYYFLINCKSNG